MDRVRIWRNVGVVWEETRLTENVTRLLNTGVSVHIHGVIPEGSVQQIPGENNRDTKTTAMAKIFNVRDNNEQ